MSQESSSRAPRINRIGIGINLVVQAILVVLIIGVINVVGFHYFKIWDVSRDRSRTLSDKTLQVLKTLPPDLKIVALYSPLNPLNEDIQNLLKDVRTASGNKLEVEFVNQYADYKRASDLQKEFKFKDSDCAVLVTAKGRTKIIDPVMMTEWDRTGDIQGLPPRPTAFKGEQVLATALIHVSEEKPRKLYFLAGHGEADVLRDESYFAIRSMIEAEGIQLQGLNLLNAVEVPTDASAIVIAGPQYDLTPRELEILQQYWDRKGRLFVLLNPTGTTPQLDALLTKTGIKPENTRATAITRSQDGTVGPENRVVGIFVGNDTPITRSLRGVAAAFPAPVKTLTLLEKEVKSQNTKLIPLFMTITGYWGETVYETKNVQYDEGVDVRGPLVICAQAEKGAVGDARVQLDSSRIVVTGNSSFIHAKGNAQNTALFAISAINWLTDREEIIGVPPKEYKLLNVDIKDDQMNKLTLLVLVVMPFSVAVLGMLVWWRRRD